MRPWLGRGGYSSEGKGHEQDQDPDRLRSRPRRRRRDPVRGPTSGSRRHQHGARQQRDREHHAQRARHPRAGGARCAAGRRQRRSAGATAGGGRRGARQERSRRRRAAGAEAAANRGACRGLHHRHGRPASRRAGAGDDRPRDECGTRPAARAAPQGLAARDHGHGRVDGLRQRDDGCRVQHPLRSGSRLGRVQQRRAHPHGRIERDAAYRLQPRRHRRDEGRRDARSRPRSRT